jgi:hypothetical protein
VERYVGRIPVEDASGCRFDVHEYRRARTLLRRRRYCLDTGELVSAVDANTFVIATTGETLLRIRA